MKNYLTQSNLNCLFILLGLFYSCTKPIEELRTPAQNIYPLDYYGFSGSDWFLTQNELAVINPKANIISGFTLSQSYLNRVSFNFSTKQFSQNLFDTFAPFLHNGNLIKVNTSKFIQLDESRFLMVNKIQGVANDYSLVYLTDSHLKNKILISDRDSSYIVEQAGILPDGKILILEKPIRLPLYPKLTCYNHNYKSEWSKILSSNLAGDLYHQNKDIVIQNNSIYILQQRDNGTSKQNLLFRFDFSGKLIKLDKMPAYAASFNFGYLLASNNGLVLAGMKYNDVSHRNDFCLLSLDVNLNPINEKIIPIVSILPDWEFFMNDFRYGFSDLIPKPIIVNNNLWMPVPYYTDRSGSSLKLIKFNKELEVELVKPIITNIKQKISNVAVKANSDYLYLGGANYKGCFFYRLNKNGDFE